jgi:CMP-2-keto-3-deoxyoctulosonic acid synthetase
LDDDELFLLGEEEEEMDAEVNVDVEAAPAQGLSAEEQEIQNSLKIDQIIDEKTHCIYFSRSRFPSGWNA